MKYVKCFNNLYELVDNCGWIKTAPLTVGKIYEVLSESKYGDKSYYEIVPDYKLNWEESYARITGRLPKYEYYTSLFKPIEEEELKQYLRDKKIEEILKNE